MVFHWQCQSKRKGDKAIWKAAAKYENKVPITERMKATTKRARIGKEANEVVSKTDTQPVFKRIAIGGLSTWGKGGAWNFVSCLGVWVLCWEFWLVLRIFEIVFGVCFVFCGLGGVDVVVLSVRPGVGLCSLGGGGWHSSKGGGDIPGLIFVSSRAHVKGSDKKPLPKHLSLSRTLRQRRDEDMW